MKKLAPSKISFREQKRMREAMEAAADRWDAYFETFAAALLDTGQEPEKARRQIELAVELADLALAEYDKRWPGV